MKVKTVKNNNSLSSHHKDRDNHNHINEPERIGITYEEIEDFIKNEIVSRKVCACPVCDRERRIYRILQDIMRDYKYMKRK